MELVRKHTAYSGEANSSVSTCKETVVFLLVGQTVVFLHVGQTVVFLNVGDILANKSLKKSGENL